MMYGKATETAIAAMSRLAEVFSDEHIKLSAVDIAESRGLQKPFVAKVMTTLSQAGLVNGSRGPGGGFSLAKHPSEISMYDVFKLFEREDDSDICPFGGGVRGEGDPCPLHEKLTNVQEAIDDVLHNTTFEVFRSAFQEDGLRPTIRVEATQPASKRTSYRAASHVTK